MNLRYLPVLLACLAQLLAIGAAAHEHGAPRHLLARSVSSSAAPSLTPTERQWLKHKQVLRLGTSAPDYPPFDINVSQHDYEGVSADFAGLVGEQLKIALQVRLFATRNEAGFFHPGFEGADAAKRYLAGHGGIKCGT